jgi:HKD family nuclease
MSQPARGLYQSLITEALRAGLEKLEPALEAKFSGLNRSDVADRLATHLAGVVEKVISAIDEERRVDRGIELTRELISRAVDATSADVDLLAERPATPGQFLTAILAVQPDGRPEVLSEPKTPLVDTALLTNAPHEPRVLHEIVTEIPSADRIDIVMAFIRRSGIKPMMEALRRHREAGRPLRVLTTVYTGSTEADALDELNQLGAEIRVSYDTSSTRLHAKAWLFHRDSGFSTAYIGSSNLTHSAQVTGLEWNVRVSAARNAPVIAKVISVIDSYWNNIDFVPFNRTEFDARVANHGALSPLSPIELRPEPFQERLLEQIALSRLRGHHRNLLVAATGTGKTVMAAIDYAHLRETLPRARLLFVAHRKEILSQALTTFRHAIRDQAFGEMWVGGARPQFFEHVFASIQSLTSGSLDALDPKHFDVVIVDEFHHSEAPTYRKLLDHVRPRELLGLTATPERADGQSLLHWFDERIAAELRLWDAIDQQKLAPFIYYGIADSLDLRELPWQRGRGSVFPNHSVQGLRDKPRTYSLGEPIYNKSR